MGAGLQQNMDAVWGPQVWRRMTNTSIPHKVYTDTANLTAKRVKKDHQWMNKEAAKKTR